MTLLYPGIGWVVDDACPPKEAAGGAAAFARDLPTLETLPEGHEAECPACQVLGEALGCVGVIEPKVPAAAEEWLASRLPPSLETLPGVLLRKNLDEIGASGEGGARLRELGLFEAPGPFSRHYGPFFRRYTVTTNQILDELFCAGDVQPAHALGVLVHLGGIAVDGEPLSSPEDGRKLAEVFERVDQRSERVLCTIHHAPEDDPGTRALKRYLRALYAAFVLDTEVLVFSPA